MRSRSRENLKFGHFTLLVCRGRQRNVPKYKTHVQSDCFCSLSLFFCGVLVAVAALVLNSVDIQFLGQRPGLFESRFNANPGLTINQGANFSVPKRFLMLIFCKMLD